MSVSNMFGLNFDMQKVVNRDFFDWPGAVPVGWVHASGVLSKDTGVYLAGGHSARIVGSATGEMYQIMSGSWTVHNSLLRFTCWVRTSDVGKVRIALLDSDGVAYSAYHSGSGVWMRLEVERNIVTPVEIRVVLLVSGSATANFDLASVSLWSMDDGKFFDGSIYGDFDIVSDFSLVMPAGHYIAREDREFVMELRVDAVVDYIKFLDLMPLIPEKFHAADDAKPEELILEDLIYQVGRYAGAWLSKIDELPFLQDPYSISLVYAQYLADLIGLQLVIGSETTLAQVREQLAQAIDWYKIKGTYESIQIVAYLSGFTTNIYDMYTTDYATFVRVSSWFVGEVGENPPGLSSAYYKSPHFGFEVVLDTIYSPGSDSYLWKDEMFTTIQAGVESTRPVNAVCHYIALLNPITIENEQVYTTTEDVRTRVTNHWQQQQLHFDMQSSFQWFIDGGKFFDRPISIWLATVTRWKLGTGNKGASPGDSGFALQNIVLEGDITNKMLLGNRVEFEILIAAGSVQGASELGIFLNDNTTPVLYTTMPDTDKTSGMELRILVQVYFM